MEPIGHASLSAFRVLAAAAKLGVLARFLTVLATVLSIGTALGNHALAARVCAFVCVGHVEVTSLGVTLCASHKNHKLGRFTIRGEGRLAVPQPAGAI